MSPRDTRTGAVLESAILPALRRGGYDYKKQVTIGSRPGGGKHNIDLMITTPRGEKILVSLKWQQTGGTAEQKVPFEVICLLKAMQDSKEYSRAYLVLGGEGWTLRDYYTSGALEQYISYSPEVKIVSLEKFIALANQTKL